MDNMSVDEMYDKYECRFICVFPNEETMKKAEANNYLNDFRDGSFLHYVGSPYQDRIDPDYYHDYTVFMYVPDLNLRHSFKEELDKNFKKIKNRIVFAAYAKEKELDTEENHKLVCDCLGAILFDLKV